VFREVSAAGEPGKRRARTPAVPESHRDTRRPAGASFRRTCRGFALWTSRQGIGHPGPGFRRRRGVPALELPGRLPRPQFPRYLAYVSSMDF